MKKKLFIIFFALLSMITFAQDRYKYRQEIQSTNDKILLIENMVKNEFGEPSSPGIWTSNNSDFGLMIRTKGNSFSISAWQISDNPEIKIRVERLMNKVKSIL
ncbi:hypothetical protein ETU08_04060 [Apibacter muscae]|uniref:Uncharacterized protein n=1 Tax=Apibacter muscae TaxID=2509004 RepID=A0A563DG25_9FLAO|nr:hypothetical protein [Apibacter muscae]TWP23858.1 hypothetical protein ETU10_06395 [Apibacter muscae]TWP29145.1 hypothetical protein ETU09_04700 [Apibacter muscae]TWP30274.1 hypothetical protein ETU08_04060 [Apibacter muscae]